MGRKFFPSPDDGHILVDNLIISPGWGWAQTQQAIFNDWTHSTVKNIKINIQFQIRVVRPTSAKHGACRT